MLDVAKMRAAHKRFLAQNRVMIETELRKGADAGVKYSKDHTGFTSRSGKTAHSTEGLVIKTRRGHVLRLRNKSKIALFMDRGTRKHPIKARRGGMLRFYWAKQGRWFTGKRVMHPGTKAYHFVRTGHRYGSARALAGMRSMMTQIAKRF